MFHLSLIAPAAAAIFALTITPAFAQSSLAQLEAAARPMHSRTCGLILLSDGRAKIRARDQDNGVATLVGAFALLQDGRDLEDKAAARTASQQLLQSDPMSKSKAIAHCQQWLTHRKGQPDFDKSEEAQWNWAQQALFTAQSEK